MANDSQGPIQVFDNSVPSLNLAFAQVLERLDQVRGLRGVVTISDSTEVGAPRQQDDAIRLMDLPGESPASPLGWLLRPGGGGLESVGGAPDPFDPFAFAVAEAIQRPSLFDFDRDFTITDSGSFTITGTGFTASVTGTAYWLTLGPLVLLYVPALSGTSNATTFTLTGLPTALIPTRNASGVFFGTDNGLLVYGVYAQTGGSATLSLFSTAAAAWAAVGTKGVNAAFWLPYALL